MSSVKKLTISGIVIALYAVLMYFTQSFAFGQYQVRIATGLYALAGVFPFLVVPLGLANMLSNILMGSFGLWDIVGGLLVGLATAGSIALISRYTKNVVLLVLPIALVPTFVVPIWLSAIIHVPYWVLVLSLGVGQVISAFTLGLVIIPISRRLIKNQ